MSLDKSWTAPGTNRTHSAIHSIEA